MIEGPSGRVAENASVEARQLADDLVEHPEELDHIVPLLPWRHLEPGSAEALVMVDKYRPAMNAFGRVFSTALIPYCANYQREVLRLFPKVLKRELNETRIQEA